MPNYKSFEDVLNDLDMDEDELKRLVSEGQIRAFRDDDRMKFRSEDVQSLNSARVGGGDDLDLGETQLGGEGLEIIEEETDETMLDLGSLTSDQDFEDTGATSVPTVELSDIGDDADATLTEELVFDETDELGGLDFGDDDADATQKIDGGLDFGDDDDLGLQTEPIDDDMGDDLGSLDELDELDDDLGGDDLGDEIGSYQEAPEQMRQAGPPMGAPVPMQIQEQVKYVEIVPNEGIPWKVLNGVTFLIAMFLLATPAAISFMGSEDVFNNGFPGASAYGYLKGPNQMLEQSTYGPMNDIEFPEPFSSSTEADQIVYPGMPIIRKSSGEDIDSASGSNDEVDEEEGDESEEEAEEEETEDE
ncbi:MAG: hypothetical protein L3J82_01635 [Planctomycetes bacterium]|nr:hypothetical protein [Planctomycetota bacterium]